jgi:hypothetical protein
MVPVSTVQLSLNQEFLDLLAYLDTFKMSLYTLNEKRKTEAYSI